MFSPHATPRKRFNKQIKFSNLRNTDKVGIEADIRPRQSKVDVIIQNIVALGKCDEIENKLVSIITMYSIRGL